MTDTKMTKTAGEHFVCSILARLNWAPALTRDGIARTDILAVGTELPDRPTIEIQVKTANENGQRTNWPINDKAQQLAKSSREWFVFVIMKRAAAAAASSAGNPGVDEGPDGSGVSAADRAVTAQVSPGPKRAEDRDATGLQDHGDSGADEPSQSPEAQSASPEAEL